MNDRLNIDVIEDTTPCPDDSIQPLAVELATLNSKLNSDRYSAGSKKCYDAALKRIIEGIFSAGCTGAEFEIADLINSLALKRKGNKALTSGIYRMVEGYLGLNSLSVGGAA